MKITKVCHFTSAHNQLDDRIYLKECISLSKAGYDVYIVGQGESKKINGVTIIGCGDAGSRKNRMLEFARTVYQRAKELDCDVYHFHDPELLPYGIKLKKMGKVVIFDSHEDVSAQIIDKTWIPKCLRTIVSFIYKRYETKAVKRFDAVVTATQHIADTFKGCANNITVINNYPKLDDIKYNTLVFANKNSIVCYAGGVSEIRGEKVMLRAIENTNSILEIAGPWESKEELSTSDHINYVGVVSREEVNRLYEKSIAGVLLYQPAKNHFESQPIKMFEYMAAGLPVICSNYPLWKEIVEGNHCGICVDPLSPSEVSDAINYLDENRDKAEMMGKAGHKAVVEKYNWNVEEIKLLKLYETI